jgi:Lar family restriction alleviation protein
MAGRTGRKIEQRPFRVLQKQWQNNGGKNMKEVCRAVYQENADNEVNLSEKPTSLKLKPCPFCGGEARLLLNAKRKIYGKDEYRTGVVACCNVCEARMFYGSEKLAIEAWNRRVKNERTDKGY